MKNMEYVYNFYVKLEVEFLHVIYTLVDAYRLRLFLNK